MERSNGKTKAILIMKGCCIKVDRLRLGSIYPVQPYQNFETIHPHSPVQQK
jgi:hypothetical protein